VQEKRSAARWGKFPVNFELFSRRFGAVLGRFRDVLRGFALQVENGMWLINIVDMS
jgi:hypothetical protein